MKEKKSVLRKFGITLAVILAIIGTIQLLKGHTKIYPWLYSIGVISIVLGIFIPAWLNPIHFAFKKIGCAVGALFTGLILVIVFYIVLTPIGLIARLFGKNFLDINWAKRANTYWIKKEQLNEGTERYERQF